MEPTYALFLSIEEEIIDGLKTLSHLYTRCKCKILKVCSEGTVLLVDKNSCF